MGVLVLCICSRISASFQSRRDGRTMNQTDTHDYSCVYELDFESRGGEMVSWLVELRRADEDKLRLRVLVLRVYTRISLYKA